MLRQSPPDILLTNHRMLDFLLLRPEDRDLWRHNELDTLRYLVLDELHIYDGPEGSDVACLIRRLKARLRAEPGSLCAVGTSATLGGHSQEQNALALVEFAAKVFGELFDRDSVITEARSGVVEELGDAVDDYVLPSRGAQLDPQGAKTLAAWLEQQARLWLPALPAGRVDAVAIGERLRRHGFLRQILRGLGGRLTGLDELDRWLGGHEAGCASWRPETAACCSTRISGLAECDRRHARGAPTPRAAAPSHGAAPPAATGRDGRSGKLGGEKAPSTSKCGA